MVKGHRTALAKNGEGIFGVVADGQANREHGQSIASRPD